MAASSVLDKVQFNIMLNNGTSSGMIKTLTVSLGGFGNGLHSSRYDDQKALNIASLLEPCLAKPVLECKKVEVSTVTSN